MGKEYLIFDARFMTDSDSAIILEACNSKRDGLKSLESWNEGDVLVEVLEDGKTNIIKVKI